MKKIDHMSVWEVKTQHELQELACPSCGEELEIDELFQQQFDARVEKQVAARRRALEDEVIQAKEMVQKEKEALLAMKRDLQEQWEKKMEVEKQKVEGELRQKLQLEYENKMVKARELEKQIEHERLVIKEKEITFLQEQQKLNKQLEEAKMSMKETHLVELSLQEQQLHKKFEQKESFIRIEFEKKLKDQQKLVSQMQQKIGQGSMKLQGTVQELAISDYLRQTFPEDAIQPVKSGAKGADCLQVVRAFDGKACGKLYYESKRTKTFQKSWIEKLKSDQAMQKADVAILVTQTFPKNMDRMGLLNGVWICSFEEFKGLTIALRDSLIRIHQVNQAHALQKDQANGMYQYLSSNEFRLQMEHIVDGFLQLQDQLNKEKRAMAQIWKKREKQIEKVLLNTNDLYHSIKSIAGDSVQDIPALDMANMQGKLL